MNNILVVKIGGTQGVDLAGCADDIARLRRPLIVVHGVSAMMDQLCAERGITVRTLTSPSSHTSRYTDAATRDVFVEACERMNETLVSLLHERGVRAQGLTGEAVPLWGERKNALRAVVKGRVCMVRDDYTGTIMRVDTTSIQAALNHGAVAVVPPLANSADGFLNVDGDRAGAAVAGSVDAADYIILSGVRGLYRHYPDEASFVPSVSAQEMDVALTWAEGRMKRKVIGASEALASGVSRVVIGDGRQNTPISAALAGIGTEFRA
ncbi:MAG: [LysW]-aminoadipate kinase [bacterium]|nr:[LysW]-aminoadipate kinase [bacterium]